MRAPIITRVAVVGPLILVTALMELLPVTAVWAREPEPKRAPARAREPEPEPARHSEKPKASGATVGLPITVRMVTWPVWMIASSEDEYPLPPILELNIGMRRRWFELSLEVGIATGKMFDAPGTYFGLGVSVGFYSLRLNRIRLRHGISMGLLSDAIFERRPERIGMMPMPMLRIRALDILVRLGGRWWLEISPLTTGFPTLYEASLGFRYELPDPTGPTGPTGPAGPPEAAGMRRPVDRTLHPFVSLEMGLVWWHHFEPSVVASTVALFPAA